MAALKDAPKNQEATNGRLVRLLVAFNVSVCCLFFIVKDAAVNNIFRINHPQGSPITAAANLRRCLLEKRYQHASSSSKTNSSRSTGKKIPGEERFSCEQIQTCSQLPRIDAFIRRYYNFSYYFNIYLLAKHIILCFLRLNSFASYRFLDCLLVGRFVVNGRVVEVAPHCGCYLIFYRIVWCYLITRRHSTYKLPVLEFLMTKWEDVELWSGSKLTKSQSGASAINPQDHLSMHSSLFEYENRFVRESQQYKLQNHRMLYKLRPNRTTKAWRRLAKTSLTFYLLFGILGTIIVMTFLLMCMPITLNRKGFEMNYRFCVQWLAEDRKSRILFKTSTTTNYSMPSPSSSRSIPTPISISNSILNANSNSTLSSTTIGLVESITNFMFDQIKPNQSGLEFLRFLFRGHFASMPIEEVLMPFGEFVNFNSYHTLRIAMDIFDSTFIYMETLLSMASMLFMAIICCDDLILYCSLVSGRVERLTKLMRARLNARLQINLNGAKTEAAPAGQQHILRSTSMDGTQFTITKPEGSQQGPSLMLVGPIGGQRDNSATKSLTLDTQAMIADLFSTINQYNEYLALQSLFLVAFWFSYSAMVSSWIFIPGNKSPKLEWYILHVFATIYMFTFMIKFTQVKRQTSELYKLIVIAMAVDNDFRLTKRTWVALLKFYSPVPLHCLRIIGSKELSLLFGLKLISWLSTALIVASSFFTTYNIK